MSEEGATKTGSSGLVIWRHLSQQFVKVVRDHWMSALVLLIVAAFVTSGLIFLGKQVLGVTHIESHLVTNTHANDTSVHLIQFRIRMDPASTVYSEEIRGLATLLARQASREGKGKGHYDSNDILRMVVNASDAKLPYVAGLLRRAREAEKDGGKSELRYQANNPLTSLQQFREKFRSNFSRSFVFASKKDALSLVWYTSSCLDKHSAATSHREPRLRFRINGQKVKVARKDNTQGEVIELKGATELMDGKRTITLQVNTIEMELGEELEEFVEFEGECLFDVTITVYDAKRKFSPARWESYIFDFGRGFLSAVTEAQ